MKSLSQLCYAAAGILSLWAPVTGSAATVYEASYTGKGLPYYSAPTAYGDEIILAGTDRVLTGFHFRVEQELRSLRLPSRSQWNCTVTRACLSM